MVADPKGANDQCSLTQQKAIRDGVSNDAEWSFNSPVGYFDYHQILELYFASERKIIQQNIFKEIVA